MTELPTGVKTLEDYCIIEHLLKDETFINSIEETGGKLNRIYPDWNKYILIFEFISGDEIHSDLDFLIKELKKINYIAEWAN